MDKREFIIKQVNELYLKFGIRSVSMDDVCKHLGISKKTLYENFKDKEELIESSLIQYLSEQIEICKSFSKEGLNVISELYKISKYLFNLHMQQSPACGYDLEKYYPILYKKIADFILIDIYNILVDNIRRGKGQGYYRTDINEKVIAKLHVFRMNNYSIIDFNTNAEFTHYDVYNEIIRYHIRGIASKKGLEYIDYTKLIK